MHQKPNQVSKAFAKAASATAHAAGKPLTFIVCCLTIVVWAAAGSMFGFSDTWQLVINTGTTIVTFLMVFLILRIRKTATGRLSRRSSMNWYG